MRRRIRETLRADDGVSLLLAMALVVGVGLIVGALVTYAGTSINAMSASMDGVQPGYDVDGALQVAVDTVRASTYNQDATAPEHCLGETSDVLKVPVSGSEVAVRCTPEPGTGADSGKVKITDDNRFADAIFTTSLGIEQGVGASVLVRGDLTSRGPIVVAGGPSCAEDASYPGGGTACGGLWAEGAVRAWKGPPDEAAPRCSGTIVSTLGTRDCEASFPVPPDEASPLPDSSTVHRPVPACGSTLQFHPGFYDDAAALSHLTEGGGCPSLTKITFAPGTYYFDFRNQALSNEADVPEPKVWPVDTTVGNSWRINKSDLTIIGGDSSGESFEDGPCLSPLKQTAPHGVRFVFGGDSRINLMAGTMALCGTYSLTDQPIAVQGASAGTAQSESKLGTPSDGSSGATSGGGFSPADSKELAQRVSSEDGDSASVTLTRQPSGPQTLWGEFTGYFGASSGIPAGAILTKATVNLKHREGGALPGETVKVTFDPDGTTGPGEPVVQAVTQEALTREPLDLLTDELSRAVHDHGLNGGKLRYELTSVAGSGSLDAEIDLATLSFTWIPPGIRAQTQDTPVLSTAPGAKFRVDGSIYTRSAILNLQLQNVDYLVVSAGIVARKVNLGIVPQDGWTRPVIQTPRKSKGPLPLSVYLVAYLCPGGCGSSSPPGNGWSVAGTAAVRFKDADAIPGPPGRSASVDSWNIN